MGRKKINGNIKQDGYFVGTLKVMDPTDTYHLTFECDEYGDIYMYSDSNAIVISDNFASDGFTDLGTSNNPFANLKITGDIVDANTGGSSVSVTTLTKMSCLDRDKVIQLPEGIDDPNDMSAEDIITYGGKVLYSPANQCYYIPGDYYYDNGEVGASWYSIYSSGINYYYFIVANGEIDYTNVTSKSFGGTKLYLHYISIKTSVAWQEIKFYSNDGRKLNELSGQVIIKCISGSLTKIGPGTNAVNGIIVSANDITRTATDKIQLYYWDTISTISMKSFNISDIGSYSVTEL